VEHERRQAVNSRPTVQEMPRTRTEPLGSRAVDPREEEPILLRRKP